VSPGVLIPIAEKTGALLPVEKMVRRLIRPCVYKSECEVDLLSSKPDP